MIDDFLQYLRYEKNYSSHTVLGYHTDLRAFCSFLQVEEIDFQPSQVTPQTVQQWVLFLSEEKMSPRSIVRKISALKTFWRYLQKNGKAEHNPTTKTVLPKREKPLPAFFKPDEMKGILDERFLTENYETLRNHLMVELLYATGIRRAELLGLKDSDIDFSAQTLRVLGKRNKERILPLGQEVCIDMKTFISLRNSTIERRENFLFLLKNGKQLYPAAVNRIVRQMSTGFSTLQKRSPHVLRHSFATAILNGGGDINAVKELLGHASLAATQVYTHTSFEGLHEIYQKAHPRGK